MSTDVKELLAELFDTVLSEPNKNYDKCYKAARAIEAQAKQIEELSAALAAKDEALFSCERATCHAQVSLIVEEALALQPHASLVAKIKADAVREFGNDYAEDKRNLKALANMYADRIERGEEKCDA